jgi:hypothetical protein
MGFDFSKRRLVVALSSPGCEPEDVVRISDGLFDELSNGMVGYPAVYTVRGSRILFHPKPIADMAVVARLELVGADE